MNLAEDFPIEMRSLLRRMKQLYNKPNAKTIEEALPESFVGQTFIPKGAVANVSELPSTDNTVGDLYHVEEDQSEYAWLPTTDYPNGHWENIGPERSPTTITVSGSTPTIAAVNNTIYECGTLTSLTVSSFPATGKFWIWFTSGNTATDVSGIDGFAVEANKKYEIEVTNGYAKMWSWPTT